MKRAKLIWLGVLAIILLALLIGFANIREANRRWAEENLSPYSEGVRP